MINLFPSQYTGVCDVERNFKTYFGLLVNKVASMFIWQNLPETIDERFLEFNLLLSGRVCWFKSEDKLYALNGSIGGEPDCYYQPSRFIIANPQLGSFDLKIRNLKGEKDISKLDGILMANSDVDYENENMKGGLYSLIYQTAGLLADNISSLNIAQINSRASTLFTADSEAQARTGEKILKEIYEGKPYRILTQDLIEKFGITPLAASGSNNTMMSLIEAHQYILAQFFQEIGVSANYNMKRERLNTAEVEMNNGALDINIFNMLKNRQEAVALINEKFGTDIKVDLNFSVFNEENGNANSGENLSDSNEPSSEENEAGAGITEGSDDDLQVDGVSEDQINVEEPKEEETAPTMEEEIEKTIETSEVKGSDEE